MDDADMASDRMAAEIELARRQITKKRELQPTGLCYNCDESVLLEHLFCDADCRKDWERFNVNNR